MQEEDILKRRDDAEGRNDVGGHYKRNIFAVVFFLCTFFLLT